MDPEALLPPQVRGADDADDHQWCVDRPHNGQEVVEGRPAVGNHLGEGNVDGDEQNAEEGEPDLRRLSPVVATLELDPVAGHTAQCRGKSE